MVLALASVGVFEAAAQASASHVVLQGLLEPLVDAAVAPTPMNVLLLAVLAVLPFVAHRVGALDIPGAVAAFALGAWFVLLGGWGWLLLMLIFSALGVVVTRIAREEKVAWRVAEPNGGRRGVSNVVANGLAAALATLTLTFAPYDAAALAFATAVAAVMADTMASEVGVLSGRARLMVPPFAPADRGQNGAVSRLGQASAFVGALLIAVAAVPLLGLSWSVVWIPLAGGFAGSQLDSLLGATLERDAIRDGPLSKADVNFIASAVPAFLVFLLVAVL